MSSDLIPIPSVLLERLRALGVRIPLLLARAGLSLARFQEPKARLTTAEFFSFWRAMEEAADRRDLALRLASEALAHQLDVASLAALHSATLGDAFAKLARYKRVVCAEEIGMQIKKGEARIGFHWTHAQAGKKLPAMLVEVTLATILSLARRGLKAGEKLAPLRLELARRREHKPMFEQFFGCKVKFDRPLDRIVFEEKLLAQPLQTHNPELLAALVPSLETALAAVRERSPKAPLSHLCKQSLARAMNGDRPSVEKLARELAMSPRTLQRRLGDEGTSYQLILDETRHAAARRLLADTDLELGEVSFFLGFAELNSFNRAFHGWEATTPLRWRKQL